MRNAMFFDTTPGQVYDCLRNAYAEGTFKLGLPDFALFWGAAYTQCTCLRGAGSKCARLCGAACPKYAHVGVYPEFARCCGSILD